MRAPRIEIVVPVYNEERALSASIHRLRAYLEAEMPFASRITIADNGSTDATPEIAAALATGLSGVDVLECEARGRGRALRAAWLGSDADVVCYMDVDLSTDLRALLPLIAPLVSGHSDVAIGSRLAPGARVVRGRRREVVSRLYNRLLHATLAARSCSRSARACASTRCRSTGSTIPTRGWTSCARRSTTCAASRGCSPGRG